MTERRGSRQATKSPYQWQADEPRLCHLDQLLKLGSLEFEKPDRVLSGGLLSLEGSGELEDRLELAREGLETVDDILWDVGPWLRPVVIVVVEFCQRRLGGSWSTDLTTGPTAVLVFYSGFFAPPIHPLQLMGNNGGNAAGVVIITRDPAATLFSSLGCSFMIFHKLLDQFDIVLEAVMSSDE